MPGRLEGEHVNGRGYSRWDESRLSDLRIVHRKTLALNLRGVVPDHLVGEKIL